MKKAFCATVLNLFIILLCISCNDVLSPDNNEKPNLNSFVPVRNGTLFYDTNSIIALFYYNAGEFYTSPYLPHVTSDLTAYLSNGYRFVNAAEIIAENIPLQLIEGTTGKYSGYLGSIKLPEEYFKCQIKDYLGSDINFRLKYAKAIEFLNFKYGDTISKSTGKILSYSGFENGGLLNVNIQNDGSANYLYLNDSTEKEPVDIIKFVEDNGALDIKSSELSILQPGRYYMLMTDHIYYETVPYLNSYIGKLSKYYITTSFYLAP